MSDTILDYLAVEEYIAQVHPDPDGFRHSNATLQGAIIAAPWAAIMLGVSRRTVLGWRDNGITYWDADRAATALGVHPTRLWPDWWHIEPTTTVKSTGGRYAQRRAAELRQPVQKLRGGKLQAS